MTSVCMLSIASFNFANAANPGAYAGLGLGGGYSSSSGSAFSGKLFYGFNFNQHVGIEGAYSNYSGNGNRVNSETVLVKGYLPLNQQFDLFAGVGGGYGHFASGSNWGATAAAGVNYNINSKASAILQYDRTVTHSNLVTLGAAYHF